MRVVSVWRRESDYGRMMEEWVTELERRTGEEIEILDPDSMEGENFCRAYSVMEYPTIMVLKDNDGGVVASWQGKALPRFDEVSYWL